jgi:cytidylate kinase
MSIITISRGSYSKGKAVAENVANHLGYECISRDILLEASEEFNIPEMKLVRALHDAPSIFNGFTHKKEKYIAYIRAALLQHFRKNDIVYHGLAGHFFVKGVSHVLKVRIIANMEDRVKLEMEREGIGEKEARHILQKDDRERQSWSQHLYGINTWDSNLYDLVIHIHKITVDDAVKIIVDTVSLENFQTTPESIQAMENVALEAEVKAAVIDLGHDIKVSAHEGEVYVDLERPIIHEPMLVDRIKQKIQNIEGVKDIRIHVAPLTPYVV